MRLGRALALGLSLTWLAASAPALGQPDDGTRIAARTLGEAGLALFAKGDYAGALEKFDRALGLVPVPTLGVRAARCLAKLGRLVEASERYREVGAMTIDPKAPAAFKQSQAEAQSEAEAERAELMKRVPTLDLELEGAAPADVALTLDGKSIPSATIGVPRPVDPGLRRIVARRGSDEVAREVTLKEGEPGKLVLAFEPRSAATPPPALPPVPTDSPAQPASTAEPGSAQRTVGFVAMGLGVVGLGIWGVTYGLASGKKSDLDALCPDRTCHPNAQPTLDSYDSLRAISTASLVAGGLFVGGGLIAVLSAPRGTAKSAALLPFIGPGGGGVRGSF